MSSVGAYLRDLRERQGSSLEELSRATRVLHHYLEALEADDLASLPAPVFTKGFIRAYCQVLGVPPDEAIALYDRLEGQDRESARPSVAPPAARDHHVPVVAGERRAGRGRGAVLVSFVLLVVLGAALFVVTLALQSGREVDSAQHARVETPQVAAVPETPPAPVPVAPPAASAERAPAQPPVTPSLPREPPSVQSGTPGPSATPPGVTLPAPPAQAAGDTVSPYRLVARTTETTWMRVRTTDGRTIEETIPAHEIREWVSKSPFILTIGNAGGVSLELNGRPIPRLGASGAVITRLVLPPETP